jgi:peptidoglycan/xylan/chitin deacetylase (PgdA/CDA1 family)
VLHPRVTKYDMLLIATLAGAVAICWQTRGVARWSWLTALCMSSGLCIGLGVSFPQWQFFGRSFCRATTTKKIVALTFDDGPDPENTPALLELLAERKIPATFFCIGQRVAGQSALVQRMAAEGHELENHTFRHSSATNLFSVAKLRAELRQAQAEIQRATGRAPRFFRPPAGLTNPRVFRVSGELGLHLAGYTARGLDRRADPPEKIAGRLLARLHPGAIYLLHDGGVPGKRLLATTRLVLDELQAAGYRCVRLDELEQEHETNR